MNIVVPHPCCVPSKARAQQLAQSRAASADRLQVRSGSTEGMVNNTLDCFVTSPLTICAEVELPIHVCLMAAPTTERSTTQRCIRAAMRGKVSMRPS